MFYRVTLFLFLTIWWAIPSFAQKITVSQCPLPRLEYISIESPKNIDHHPVLEFRGQFAVSWVMAEHYKVVFSQLSKQDQKTFLGWIEQESKELNRRREIVWRQIEKQNPKIIPWLIRQLSDSLLNSFIIVKTADYASPAKPVPIIDYWQCQIADLNCLEYFCRYKSQKGELKYNPVWFVATAKPMPEKIIAMLAGQKPSPFAQNKN
jgi:hypothetical protein